MTTFPLEIGTTCDMHVHLRDGQMCDLVTPTVKEGGINVAYIMPNLQPPVTTIEQVKSYKAKLDALSPDTKFSMSFYLNDTITDRKRKLLNPSHYLTSYAVFCLTTN